MLNVLYRLVYIVPAYRNGHMPDFRHLIGLCARHLGASRGPAGGGPPPPPVRVARFGDARQAREPELARDNLRLKPQAEVLSCVDRNDLGFDVHLRPAQV